AANFTTTRNEPGRVYVRTYFPDTVSTSEAVPLDARGSAETRADMQLQTVRANKISGRVINPYLTTASTPNNRPPAIPVRLVPRDANAFQDNAATSAAVRTQADGTFEITGVPQGAYDLVATADLPDNLHVLGVAAIDVGSEDIKGVTIAVR